MLVGLIDSGVGAVDPSRVAASCRFIINGHGECKEVDATPDQLGHGTAMAQILLDSSESVTLCNAQVFESRLVCSALQVATALDWLTAQGVQLVNMSFGLREDRPVLREACNTAVARGIVLVAASPARGEGVYPASYPGVIRATGDARCAIDELSFLDTKQADFGAHVRADGHDIAGASIGCARVSAMVAAFLVAQPGASAQQIKEWLTSKALYHGPEQRQN